MSDSLCKSVPSQNKMPSQRTKENGPESPTLTKNAVVVLTRLPEYKISALRPPTPQQFYSEDELLSSSDSEMQWEPDAESSESDYSPSNKKQKPVKPKSVTPAPPTSSNDSKNSVTEETPVVSSVAFASNAHETTKMRPNLPEKEVKVDMMVLGRRRAMRWQRGKIVEIITKEDGRVKYKVSFEEKGKSLVSGHHIAFDTTPKLDELYVGARVAVQSQDNKSLFEPGVLAELPARKNHSRFLVFLDDHRPLYVGLPQLHLVCRPLEDVLEDIPESPHKHFIKRYLNDWPYPHLTYYRVGQILNTELAGAQQKCEVQVVDCSLMEIVFQENQQKEWIYRGSMRLEHMSKFLEMQEAQEQNGDSTKKPEDKDEL